MALLGKNGFVYTFLQGHIDYDFNLDTYIDTRIT